MEKLLVFEARKMLAEFENITENCGIVFLASLSTDNPRKFDDVYRGN